ncbi:integrase [Candidatus Uhrbacteria bacterium]|nr:integrase [Candidatus Uhrbacteria bacterium]
MTQPLKSELLNEVKPRYLKADKPEKQRILDEFCESTGYHRKHAVRILALGYARTLQPKRHRPIRYHRRLINLIIRLWQLLDYPCGIRLKPQLLPLTQCLEKQGEETPLDVADKKLLGNISPSTLDRRLRQERRIRRLSKGRGTTRHGSLLKTSVPIRITNWNTRQIGFMEMDTVAHCGSNLSGEFIYSLDLVEIATGWSEQIAIMGKGEAGVIRAIEAVKKGLPFTLKGLDSDTGSEFVNWHMVKFCQQNNLFFTRSRPDRKNDNAYVEQKNYTHIRKWLGYVRYDKPEQLNRINDLYRNELRLFNNFFRPVMKIKEREKINNSVCRKKYDVAQTPYQRLMKSKQIPPETKSQLLQVYESLNPVTLKKEIETKLKRILKG